MLAVIGSSPFHPSDIAQFVVDAGPGSISECVHIAEDALECGHACRSIRGFGEAIVPTPADAQRRGGDRHPPTDRGGVGQRPRGPAIVVSTDVDLLSERFGREGVDDEVRQTVTIVTDRVAARLIEEIEHDDARRSDRRLAGAPLATDERRQQLLVGAWIGEEITTVNEERLQRGQRSLVQAVEQRIRARVVAELTGAGPLEPYLNDPDVEEIDVNGPDSTWVTYTDGRKLDVGALWSSAAELTAFQKRMALRMTGTGEGRLDTSSPMLTLQSRDGARIVMVLGGSTEHGVSTHPRLAIRRFVVRQVGLAGLAELGLFPSALVDATPALVRCGFTILVSGPPGAGKTTLLTELLGEVSPLERIITVEKNLLELRLEDDPRHPDAPASPATPTPRVRARSPPANSSSSHGG